MDWTEVSMKPVNLNIKTLPVKLSEYLSDSQIFESSGCSKEKTYFIDGSDKYYLKTGNPVHLLREFKMTQFLNKGFAKGCHIRNGFEMLNLQAEKSWEIWTS